LIYEPFDIVVVPIPFTDYSQKKCEPALLLAQKIKIGSLL